MREYQFRGVSGAWPPSHFIFRGVAQLVNKFATCQIVCSLRGVAQLVARFVWDEEAPGSNPGTPTRSSSLFRV